MINDEYNTVNGLWKSVIFIKYYEKSTSEYKKLLFKCKNYIRMKTI